MTDKDTPTPQTGSLMVATKSRSSMTTQDIFIHAAELIDSSLSEYSCMALKSAAGLAQGLHYDRSWPLVRDYAQLFAGNEYALQRAIEARGDDDRDELSNHDLRVMLLLMAGEVLK